MNRRDFVKQSTVLGLLPIVSVSAAVKLEVLMHSPDATRYETLRIFKSREEAEALVKALRPRLVSATMIVSRTNVRSGSRRAVRVQLYKANDIVKTLYEIVDSRTNEVIIDTGFDACPMFDCGRAWSIIENVRVDGIPVTMNQPGKLPFFITQPVITAGVRVSYMDTDGYPLTDEEAREL